MDEVEALTELKSRISADDWRTICDYVFKERELADQALASSRNDVLEEAARIAKTAWLTVDHNAVGILDADAAMALCEHAETAIRARKDQEHG